jgi:hypothetical protein
MRAPTFYATDGVEGIHTAVPGADIEDAMMHQR